MSNTHKLFPHIHKGRFYNHVGEKKPNVFIPSLRMLLEWHMNGQGKREVNKELWFEQSKLKERCTELAITWIGHSTFLIQIGGFNILTDPLFGNLSPLFPRILPPGIALEQLPEIDYVIISHNHRDHMDAQALCKLNKKYKHTRFLVPQGDKQWFNRRSFTHVQEHMWWDKHRYSSEQRASGEIAFTFLPAYHWTQRGLFDYNKSLWGSWMIECNGMTLYFAGDTAYSPHFKSIAQEFSTIDIAFMPIGPCEPRAWMNHSHVSAEQAGQAFIELNAQHFIPMHWGTYYFGVDYFELPYERITAWWTQQMAQSNKHLHVLKIGQQIVLDKQATIKPAYQAPELII